MKLRWIDDDRGGSWVSFGKSYAFIIRYKDTFPSVIRLRKTPIPQDLKPAKTLWGAKRRVEAYLVAVCHDILDTYGYFGEWKP